MTVITERQGKQKDYCVAEDQTWGDCIGTCNNYNCPVPPNKHDKWL